MATIPSLPSRDDVLRMARNTTDITGQLLDTAGNITRIAMNTFDPRDGSGAEVLRVLRETTAELAEASASPQAQEAFYRIVDTLTRLGTSGAPLAVHPVSEPAQALLTAIGDSLLPVLDAVEPAVEEFADALGDLVEATSPLLPAAAGVAAGALLAVTPVVRAVHELGSQVESPFQSLAFLALSVIPSLKITDRGLVDVDRFELVPLAADAVVPS